MTKTLNLKLFGLAFAVSLMACTQKHVFAAPGNDEPNQNPTSSQRSETVGAEYSFFNAPMPRRTSNVFNGDPSILGRRLARPSRPMGVQRNSQNQIMQNLWLTIEDDFDDNNDPGYGVFTEDLEIIAGTMQRP